MISIRIVILIFLVAAIARDAFADPGRWCVREHLSAIENGAPVGLSASDAEQLVANVAMSIGLMRPVAVIPCAQAEKAFAWVASASDHVPEGEYIVYNPDWVREVLGRDRVQAVALFGHELGHFLNADFTSRRKMSQLQRERDADRFAGCAVARMSGAFSRLEDLLSRIRQDQSTTYPDRLSSIKSAKAGYITCGGVTAGTPNKSGVLVQKYLSYTICKQDNLSIVDECVAPLNANRGRACDLNDGRPHSSPHGWHFSWRPNPDESDLLRDIKVIELVSLQGLTQGASSTQLATPSTGGGYVVDVDQLHFWFAPLQDSIQTLCYFIPDNRYGGIPVNPARYMITFRVTYGRSTAKN